MNNPDNPEETFEQALETSRALIEQLEGMRAQHGSMRMATVLVALLERDGELLVRVQALMVRLMLEDARSDAAACQCASCKAKRGQA